jgi:hypothetical protein
MNALSFMNSPLWLTAGWTMLHFIWVGAVIGLLAAIARWILKPASCQTRYLVALVCFASLALAPLLIAARLDRRRPTS